MGVTQLLKWLSQFLILVGGVWALLSDTHGRDPTTGQRKLTHSGRMQLSIFVIGFALFISTELENQMQQREAIRTREQEIKLRNQAIENQNIQLEYLRKLFLLQHEVSAIEVSWTLSAQEKKEFSDSLLEYGKKVNAEPELQTNLQYINSAFQHFQLNVRQKARGLFDLQVLFSRPQAPGEIRLLQFSEEQPEWKAFDTAIRRLLGDRFEIELDRGGIIADLAKKHWPCQLSIDRSTMRFTVENSGVSLGQLEGANVTFWGGDVEPTRMPKLIRLLSKDPKVMFDKQFKLDWKKHPLFSATNEAGRIVAEYSNVKTEPLPLSASIRYDLLPHISQPPSVQPRRP